MSEQRILSGMRPTGELHLGHYQGVLKNWLQLQTQYQCYFFVADWHALTTHYESASESHLHELAKQMVIDWLAVGIDPNQSTVFIQSEVPEHAELHVLLSMITPLSWLERVPTYKDQQQKLKDKDLSTLGFLGYPLLQAADILSYRAGFVPVGEDQLPHIEFTREIARRFNHMYGLTPKFHDEVDAILAAQDKDFRQQFKRNRRKYLEQGDQKSRERGLNMLDSLEDETKLLLQGYFEGTGKIILPEPQGLTTKDSCVPGLDGQKMSKSYHNTISLRDEPTVVEKKIKTMPTDPARVKRTDPGTPEKCPVWKYHEIYSDSSTKDWVQKGCTSAGIGCIECKQPIIDAVNSELLPIQKNILALESDSQTIDKIIKKGCEKAKEEVNITLRSVKQAMGL